jgi:lipooligosaccharide transport system permease protein
MVQRNVLVYKHMWMVIVSGFFEPLFYLVSLGLGLGAMVPDIGGTSYGAFVAPGLLAASCLNAAISDGFFNIFFKLHFEKTYDGILATPMRVPDVAFGEALWALTRGSIYAATFLVVVLVMGELVGPRMLLSAWAVFAFPAAVLAAASFSAMALCMTSFVRRVEQFDTVMGLVVMPMFLFSGIFFPVSRFPGPLEWVVQAVPLYHAVEMLRQLTTGALHPSLAFHIAYLVLAGAAAFIVAMRRLERTLIASQPMAKTRGCELRKNDTEAPRTPRTPDEWPRNLGISVCVSRCASGATPRHLVSRFAVGRR